MSRSERVCDVPPEGWYCTRPRGHEGPCAAWPELSAQADRAEAQDAAVGGLLALEALAKAATGGEWRRDENTVWGACDPDDTTSYGMGIAIADCRTSVQKWALEPLDYFKAEQNAAYIAAANPATVLSLIEQIRSLQAERDALREAATLAADTFARYAELHWAKGTEDAVTKGDANAELAKTMRAALAMQGGGVVICNLCRGTGSLMCCWPLEFHRCPKCAGNGATQQFGTREIGASK